MRNHFLLFNLQCGVCNVMSVYGLLACCKRAEVSVELRKPSVFRERERKMFYLTTHSTHFIYGYMASDIWLRTILIVREVRERERNVLFNDALNTFYLRLYGVRHMVKDHSDSERGNPLSPHRLLLSINSKGSFICTIPQTG